ncbi:hypothetical protein PVAND_017472 [Polypedilum vanderplanki]|uniref:DNA/RNA non-specific endonuclease/pyrophosphatase/phosphodiesterase domain-containing protein n=1 Tax=Polypedilum vanderplanki TaxID=319348 RepID=A0A9J6BI69_POLVA|nr:hypothetical protein PVAND_017472 [Polypedilum vanderplanki]
MKIFSVLVIFIAFYINSNNFIKASIQENFTINGCNVNLRTSFSQNSPLLVQDNKLYRPTNKAETLLFSQNEIVEIYCEEWINHFVINSKKTFRGSLNAICANGNNFLIHGMNITFPFQDLKCKHLPRFTRKPTTIKCYNEDDNAVLHEIGYQIDKNRFLSLYESCFNGQRTWYTKYNIDKFWNNFIHFKRPTIFENDVYNMSKNYYNTIIQKEKLREIFSGSLPKEIQELYENGGFFNRGHLAASSDFIFPSNKNLTFHLINVAPQWSKFNSGNCAKIETATANYAAKMSKNLTTYTGTFGVINFKAYGVNKDFYLGNEILPVPKLYYRIIMNDDIGVVLIGVNDPFPKNIKNISDYIICQDISDDYKWDASFDLWYTNRKSIGKGYSYACELNEFLKIVKISDIEKISGILGVTKKKYFNTYSVIIIISVAAIFSLLAAIGFLIYIEKLSNHCLKKPWELKATNNYDRFINDPKHKI